MLRLSDMRKRARNLVPRRIRRSPRRSLLPAASLFSLPASAAIAGISTSPACTPRPAPNTSLIASSHFPLTHAHVAFAIATATACMVNCLCVAHAHVFVGCSNLSPAVSVLISTRGVYPTN